MERVLVETNRITNVLTINAGSSSVKLDVFEAGVTSRKLVEASVKNIGQPTASFITNELVSRESTSQTVVALDHIAAATILVNYLRQSLPSINISAIGHRIVHGGSKYSKPCLLDNEVLAELNKLIFFDPEHLPIAIKLIESFKELFPGVKQIACFDTAFHHNLPTVAKLLPIPRRYERQGIYRYGFHGLSYTFVLQELEHLGGSDVLNSRLILAHLGNGVSLAAVKNGQSIDTTMGLTPSGGVPMSTRSGDLDPGLASYLANSEHVNTKQFNNMVNFESGLLGVSELTSDMEQLLIHEADNIQAKEAINLFCYQVKKSIGGLAAALGGLDTLVFTGGMGENAPKIRARVCEELQFLGIEVEEARNANNADLISSDTSQVAVRVIHTDESSVIAQDVWQLVAESEIVHETE